MATHFSHSSLPFPVRHARFTVVLPFMDADGDPTDPTATLDTEISVDAAADAPAAEELTVIGTGMGWGMVTLTGAEMNSSLVVGQVNNGSAKAPQFAVQPRTLPVVLSGTAQAGAAGTITLPSAASALDDAYNGCIVKTTGGTGGGGTGGANNQARVIKDYVGSTRVATIEPNWETTPDNTTTLEVLVTDLAAFTSTAIASAVLDEATSGHATAGTFGKAISDTLAAVDTEVASLISTLSSVSSSLSTITGLINTEVADILADTNELQTDWANGGRLDLLIDAIKAKTDTIPASPAAVGDIPSAATNAAALLAAVVEGVVTVLGVLRIQAAAQAGDVVVNTTTGEVLVKSLDGTKNRVTATGDEDGNRTVSGRDLT